MFALRRVALSLTAAFVISFVMDVSLAPAQRSELSAAAPEIDGAIAQLVARKRELGAMGTDLSIEVIGTDAGMLEAALDAATLEIRRVEDVMTDWRASPLTRLNDDAGKGFVPVDREVVNLLIRAMGMARLTDGAFDISYAGAGRLWNFKARDPAPPNEEEIAAALLNVGWQRVQIDATNGRVDLPIGMKLGLGGIAKGYGVDRAMAVLMEQGVQHAIVNAGGDMKILGRNFGEPWEVAIKHPRDRERAIAALRLSNVSVVTSGDYERFFEFEGRRYHHVIDPRTGYPATGATSATVIAPHAEFADALATALCVMQPKAGLALIEDLPRTEAIIVGFDGVVHATSGLVRSITP